MIIDNIVLLRKKLIYRSLHRGCRETDVLLGYFALKHLNEFSLQELKEYEKIINHDDNELYRYFTGRENIPTNLNEKMINLLIEFIKTNPLPHS